MINFQYRKIGGEFFPQLRVQTLAEALNACLFVLSDLKDVNNWYLALSGMGNDQDSFPNIHIQNSNGELFCQVYLAAESSPEGKEGWFTRFEQQEALKCRPFILTEEISVEDRAQYFDAAFTQGVSFSRRFLVSRRAVVKSIRHFSETKKNKWVNGNEWLNLGLL